MNSTVTSSYSLCYMYYLYSVFYLSYMYYVYYLNYPVLSEKVKI